MKKADPVAAIPEPEATGEIADIYEDIRQTLGVDVVNLVWRHLATIDGALPWAWRCVRPAYRSGAVTSEAEKMKKSLRFPRLPQMTPDLLAAAGVSSEDFSTVTAIQLSYDRSNAMNFLVLSALSGAGKTGQDLSRDVRADRQASEKVVPIGALPPLPSLDDAGPELLAMLERLNALAQVRDDAIMVSMYRQLSYWPGYLALISAMMAPLAEDGSLQNNVAETEKAAIPFIGTLASRLEVPEEHELARSALRHFLERVNIPKMIVITGMLLDASPEPDLSWSALENSRW